MRLIEFTAAVGWGLLVVGGLMASCSVIAGRPAHASNDQALTRALNDNAHSTRALTREIEALRREIAQQRKNNR